MTETDESTTVLAQQTLWRKRLAEAEARYHDADVGLQRVAAVGGGGTRDARARKLAARTEYLRVLRIFTDLVLRGKSPESEN